MEVEEDLKDQRYHNQLLKSICRLCGKDATHGGANKEAYAKELKSQFDIDVLSDSSSIHPAKLCGRHKSALYRIRNTKSKAYQPKVKITPLIFREHDVTCTLCNPPSDNTSKQVPETSVNVQFNVEKSGVSFAETGTLVDSQVHDHQNGGYQVTGNDGHEGNVSTVPEISVNAEKDGNEVVDHIYRNNLLRNYEVLNKEEKHAFIDNVISESDTENLIYIASSLGTKIKSDVHKDASVEAGKYKDSTSYSELSNPSSWLAKANPVLVALLDSLGNSSQQCNVLRMRIIENIMKLTMPSLISRFAFLENSAIYLATGSKFAANVLGKISPGGCYKTVTNWLRKPSAEAQKCPDGIVMNVFDNEQVIGRKSQITPSQITPVSVITNHAFVQLKDDNAELQNKPEFKPVVPSENDFKTAINEARNSDEHHREVHYKELVYQVNAAIEEVRKTHSTKDTDHIDQIIKEKDEARRYLICTLCGEKNNKRFLVCRSCNEREGISEARKSSHPNAQSKKTSKQETGPSFSINLLEKDTHEIVPEISRFDHVPSSHDGTTKLLLADPVFCNPNSLETVAQVLRKIGKDNGIYKYGGTKRQWTFVCCDGLPYNIIRKLMDEAVICSQCHKHFLNKGDFHKHLRGAGHNNDTAYTKEFDWFYLQIGPGHYEMNLVRSFFELNWTPFLESLCAEMGFVSESAKQFALRCKDTHKSYSLLLVFHLGALREFVTTYYRHCLSINKEPTTEGFLEDAPELFSSPNARYLFEQVCRFSLAILNHRMAVRRNNAALLSSSRYMTSPLFFGRNHPRYQEIWLFDEIQRTMMVDQVRKIYDVNVSGTTSGHKSLGQGFDFLLEEKNRELKDWIPNGYPTDQTWLAGCRNVNEMKTMRSTLGELLGLSTNTHDGVRRVDLEEPINAWRALLRSSNYILKAGSHESVTGKDLDFALKDFLQLADGNKSMFLSKYTNEGDDRSLSRQQIVYITPEERKQRTSPEALTKAELIESISELIQCLQDVTIRERFSEQLASVRKGRKDGLVRLHNELVNNY